MVAMQSAQTACFSQNMNSTSNNTSEGPAGPFSHFGVRMAALGVALVAAVLWASAHYLQPLPPRHIVLASGAESGIYYRYAMRYKELLGRAGLVVDVRMTEGAEENLRLLLDPHSGVDVAFMQGGVASAPAANELAMLASLYYEPLWIFYRDPGTLTEIKQLYGKRIAIGLPGSGTRALVMQLFTANGLIAADGRGRDATAVINIGGDDALRALKSGGIDAALYVGGAETPTIQQLLRDPEVKLMSLGRVDAYPRRLPFLTRLTLPGGTVDLATDTPSQDVAMIGTNSMLVVRSGLHPAVINLLLDVAHDVHGQQGYFEAAGEFPGTAHVDAIPVSSYADQHRRFGPSWLSRYMPFWVAAFVERALIVLIPLVVVLVPLFKIRVFRKSCGSFEGVNRPGSGVDAGFRACSGAVETAIMFAWLPQTKRRRRLWDAYAFPGFRPQPTVRGVFGDPKARVITLDTALKKTTCGCCGRAQSGWYDRRTRQVRDLSCGDTRIYLEIEVRRVQCRRCGKVKRERLEFLADNPFYTKRFAHYVGRRCRSTTIKDVAKELHLDWDTVKTLEKQYMRAQLAKAGTPGPKAIGIDEISIRKGHTYRIVVSDLLRRRPIWFGGEDRSEKSMAMFYE